MKHQAKPISLPLSKSPDGGSQVVTSNSTTSTARKIIVRNIPKAAEFKTTMAKWFARLDIATRQCVPQSGFDDCLYIRTKLSKVDWIAIRNAFVSKAERMGYRVEVIE